MEKCPGNSENIVNFLKEGAKMDKKESGFKLSGETSEKPEPEKKELPCCPKCGYQATGPDDPIIVKHDGLGECPSCGIIVAKYLEKHADELAASEPVPQENEEKDEGTEDPPVIKDDYIID